MSGHSKARNDKRKKQIRQRKNAEKTQAHRRKAAASVQRPAPETTPSTTT